MSRYFLWVSVALLRVRNAKLQAQNELLKEQLDSVTRERNEILKQYFEFVAKVTK